jgi:hypothetical protein
MLVIVSSAWGLEEFEDWDVVFIMSLGCTNDAIKGIAVRPLCGAIDTPGDATEPDALKGFKVWKGEKEAFFVEDGLQFSDEFVVLFWAVHPHFVAGSEDAGLNVGDCGVATAVVELFMNRVDPTRSQAIARAVRHKTARKKLRLRLRDERAEDAALVSHHISVAEAKWFHEIPQAIHVEIAGILI